VTSQFFLDGLSEKNKDSSLKRNRFLCQHGKKIVEKREEGELLQGLGLIMEIALVQN
jgi:hypothetical protein